jgi:hypothetical protein
LRPSRGTIQFFLRPLTILVVAVAGCSHSPEAPVVAKPIAPQKPKAVSAATLPAVKFVDITEEFGIKFTHVNGAAGEKLLPETMGSGVAVLDYDGDGDQDLFFVNSRDWPGKASDKAQPPTHALYRNDGKGHFHDVTRDAGLDKVFFGQGVAVGDYDNDGDPDLYITAVPGGYLFRNDGGKFTDVTAAANARGSDGWLTSAAFFDMENDGDLDLFVCCYLTWSQEIDRGQDFQLHGHGRAYGRPSAFGGTFCVLLRNDGGKFTDVSEESGINVRTVELKVPVGKALGVAPYDVDGDGLVDLAVANDTVQNFLFHNLGSGKFEEVAIVSGTAFDKLGSPRGGMGIDWADFRNDGTLALAVGNFANEMVAFYVCDDPKALLFSDLANIYGLGAPTQPPLKFGLFFFDYDLDGRLDLLSTNGHLESDIAKVQASETYEQPAQLFWNTGQTGSNKMLYTLVGPDVAGPDLFRPIVGRGSAYADLDGDGDLDVILTVNGGRARVLRNDGGNKNHWIRLALAGTRSNRSAIGAKVTLYANNTTCRRQLFPAKSYLSSVELPLTFGLGKTDKVDRVVITWPSGKETELKDLAADKTYSVRESDAPTVTRTGEESAAGGTIN